MQILHEQQEVETILSSINQTQFSAQTTTQEHVTLPKTIGNRIVSKRRYAANVGKKVVLSSVSLGFLLMASFTLVGALIFVSLLWLPAGRQTDFGTPEEALPWILGFGAVSLLCYLLAWRTLKGVGNVETGVPFTRANTADLPALESLVRASEEPVQLQAAVLLRAAVESVERHKEHLVQAVEGQE